MSKVIRIIICGQNVGGFGGMETVFRTFSKLLIESEKDYQISFAFFNEKNNTVDDQWLGKHDFARLNTSMRNRKLKRLSLIYQFSSLIKKTKQNYIIAFDSIGCYISRLALRFSFKKIPLFSWSHFSVTDSYKAKYLLMADKHLSISSGISQQLSKMGVSSSDIYTIYNPVPMQEKTINCGDKTNFLYLGRVMSGGQKNMNELFRALSGVNDDWNLHIVGSGDESEVMRLKNLAHELNVSEKIIWHGWQTNPWNYVANEIKNISALILTSTYEGLPMVLCEANSYGIYTVSSDCPTGPADVIQPYKNGELYPVGNDKKLTRILQKIAANKTAINPEIIKDSISEFYENEYLSRPSAIFR
ncbi:glycosyltransferase [Morganella morganii]|uniref:glycosyltransferase n=1 Tax=Morganella morganii TaxID=582 RepID=UPI001C48EA26|nr:glycosyltransferase [Morganella morganii]QXO64334.1 glycosyltransferase [Morganella morganii]